jgi:hypothetical protein
LGSRFGPVVVRTRTEIPADTPSRLPARLLPPRRHAHDRGGRFVENLETGDFSLAGQHPFFDYFELGQTAAIQPLCDGLD